MQEKAEAATEITVSAPNRPGELARILKALADNAVNIRAYTAYVDADRGYVKFVPEDLARAASALTAADYHFTQKSVILVECEDALGACARVATAIAEAGLHVGHAHASSAGSGPVLLVFNTSDNERALDAING